MVFGFKNYSCTTYIPNNGEQQAETATHNFWPLRLGHSPVTRLEPKRSDGAKSARLTTLRTFLPVTKPDDRGGFVLRIHVLNALDF